MRGKSALFELTHCGLRRGRIVAVRFSEAE